MKINELKGFKSDPILQRAKATFAGEPPVWDKQNERYRKLKTFTQFLVDQGFTRVGMGSFAAVYEKPGYPWLFKLFNHDTAYEKYIRWVIKNQNNPHVPKIKGNLFPINKNTYVVRMEKLTPIDFGAIDQNTRKLISILDSFEDSSISTGKNRWLKETYPGIWNILQELEHIGNQNNVSLDIHMNNIMMRGDTPVITDPLYDPNDM